MTAPLPHTPAPPRAPWAEHPPGELPGDMPGDPREPWEDPERDDLPGAPREPYPPPHEPQPEPSPDPTDEPRDPPNERAASVARRRLSCTTPAGEEDDLPGMPREPFVHDPPEKPPATPLPPPRRTRPNAPPIPAAPPGKEPEDVVTTGSAAQSVG
jgi:periplasmic protein TonB